jgi:outer membrane protein TolC
MTLPELVFMARSNPGIDAAQQALSAFEAQLAEARRAWIPQGTVDVLEAPAPEVHCVDANGNRDPNCPLTDVTNTNQFKVGGAFTRIELKVGMPLYTFGKLYAARQAAAAGVDAGRAQLDAARLQVVTDVTRAYQGVKVAREILHTIAEGRDYLDKAMKKIEEDIESSRGEATETDRLRLKVLTAEVDARTLEAQSLARLGLAALRVLVPDAPGDLDVDDAPLVAVDKEPRPLSYYVELARLGRPEIRLVDAGLAARRAAEDVERARIYPDLLLVGTLNWAYAPSVDDPPNFFANDPFNGFAAGIGALLRIPLDYPLKLARLDRAAAERREMEARRRQALGGIGLDIERSYAELQEARARMVVSQGGERAARAWLVATYQNLMLGLVEPKELTDALLAFFTLKLRALQAVYDVNANWTALGRAVGTMDL